VLAIALGFGCAAGHFGGSITHGGDFLLEPLKKQDEPAERSISVDPPADAESRERPSTPETNAAAPLATFAGDVAPILEAKCVGCHGEDKRKGRLALHTREAIEKGGADGAVLTPGSAATSALIERMQLPSDDDDHMPPGEKPQPSAREIALIAAWIDAGASFDAGFAFDPSAFSAEVPTSERETATDASPAPAADDRGAANFESDARSGAGASAPDRDAVAALTERLVHVQPIAQDDPLLWIDFAAPAATIDDATAVALLTPLVEHVGDLSLARTKAGDETLRTVQKMRSLRRLDLRSTPVTDQGLQALVGAPELRELNLSQTALGDAAVDVLVTLDQLERVFVWRSSISAAALARLHELRPRLEIDAGDAPDSAALEVEPAVRFTSDAPLPGAKPASADGAALTPANAICPVSGSPVNPKYAIVFEGKVVGFCCPNCPKEFWTDPAAFADKLAQK